MDLKEKQLLLADLCARLPYGVKVYNEPYTFDLDNFKVSTTISKTILEIINEGWKPYLRPMSSMTEEEEIELGRISSQLTFDRRYNLLYVGRADDGGCNLSEMEKIVDYLISHHFDFRGLISLGLALEAPEGMY